MKIELKNIKHSESLSQETNAFTASIHIDGQNVGHCENQGHGGCTIYRANNIKNNDIIKKAEAWAKSLPAIKTEYGDLDSDLELVIDNLLEDFLKEKDKAKFKKKLEKDMLKGIVYGSEKNGYTLVSWKHPLSVIVSNDKGVEFLRKYISELLPKLKSGEKILNTNLPFIKHLA